MTSHCGFDLHFCWLVLLSIFHVPDGHLHIFFEKNVYGEVFLIQIFLSSFIYSFFFFFFLARAGKVIL